MSTKERAVGGSGTCSRASLRLGRWAAGVGNSRTWQSWLSKLPQTLCARRCWPHGSSHAFKDIFLFLRSRRHAEATRSCEAAWQLRPEQHYADEKHVQTEDTRRLAAGSAQPRAVAAAAAGHDGPEVLAALARQGPRRIVLEAVVPEYLRPRPTGRDADDEARAQGHQGAEP